MKKTRFISILLAISLFIGMTSGYAVAESAASLKSIIEAHEGGGLIAEVEGKTVTVTGTVEHATETLPLELDPDVTVVWKANLSSDVTKISLVRLSGAGVFELAEGGILVQSDEGDAQAHALLSMGTTTVNVTGGTASSLNGAGIHAPNCTVNISGGVVRSERVYAVRAVDVAISGNAEVVSVANSTNEAAVVSSGVTTVMGGTVRNLGGGHAISNSGSSVVVGGNAVVSAKEGRALFFSGNVGATVTIGGDALVMATNARVVMASSANARVVIKDNATVFAYGSGLNLSSVIASRVDVEDDALLVGWTDSTDTKYYEDTNKNIVTYPYVLDEDDKVGWVFGDTTETTGIAYERGGNTGIIPLKVEEQIARIVVEPSSLDFKVGVPVADWKYTIRFVISNDTFKNQSEITLETLAALITGLPEGVTIGFVSHNSTNDTEVYASLTGTPTKAYSGEIEIVGALPSKFIENYPKPVTPEGVISFTVEKGDGAEAVTPPTVSGTPTTNTITITEAELCGNTTQDIEYAISLTNVAPTDGWTTDLVFAGLDEDTTYYIFARAAENDDYVVGEPCAGVEIRTLVANYGIALDITEHTFPDARRGYADQSAVTVTITNTGNVETGALEFNLNDADFLINGTDAPITLASIGVGESVTFNVVPKTGLAVGAHADVVTITGGNGITATLDVSFTVKSSGGGGFWEPDPTPTTPGTGGGSTPDDKDDDGPTTIITDDGTEIEVPGGSTISDDGKVVVGEDGAEITYTDGGKGSMPGGFEFQLDPDAPHGFRALTSIFDDVFVGDWYFDDVHGAYFLRLMVGTSLVPPLFSPNMSTTRAMVITVMHRLELVRSGVADYSQLSSFNDVPTDTWYTAAAAWGEENEVIYGVAPERYAPNRAITRQDLAAILMRYADFAGIELPEIYEPTEFVDADEISPYAKDAVEALCRAGVIFGKPGGVFDPKGNATRAEMAAMLTRFLKFVDVEVLAA